METPPVNGDYRESALGENVEIDQSPQPRCATITQVVLSLVDPQDRKQGVSIRHQVEYHDNHETENIDLKEMLKAGKLKWCGDCETSLTTGASSNAQHHQNQINQMKTLVIKMTDFIEVITTTEEEERYSVMTSQSTEDLCREIEEADTEVLERYKNILIREMQESKVPTSEEFDFLKALWWFFLVYVEFYKQVFQRRKEWNHHYVFIAHRSNDKLAYVIPLSQHIHKGDKVVFVDSGMKRGAQVRETVLTAALSCTVYWCVTTEVFFTDHIWPLREFIIGCCRFMLESKQQASRYCLMMDCVETGGHGDWPSRHAGQWQEKILRTKSLQMYNTNGEPVSFPAMEHANGFEAFTSRYKRLCARPLSNGDILVRDEDGAISHQELLLHKDFPIKMFRERAEKAKYVRICNTWMPNIDMIAGSLSKAAQRGARIEILLLDPNSAVAGVRSRALEHSSDSFDNTMNRVKEGYKRNLDTIQSMIRELRSVQRDETKELDIVVRTFGHLPPFMVYQADDVLIIGHYLLGRLALDGYLLECKRDSGFGEVVCTEINLLGEDAEFRLGSKEMGNELVKSNS